MGRVEEERILRMDGWKERTGEENKWKKLG